jgi:hypothetical protein
MVDYIFLIAPVVCDQLPDNKQKFWLFNELEVFFVHLVVLANHCRANMSLTAIVAIARDPSRSFPSQEPGGFG